MLHELWVEENGEQMFCLAGPHGDAARRILSPGAKMTWTVDAKSHMEAMTLYYEYMGWGTYTTDYPEIDNQTYAERGLE